MNVMLKKGKNLLICLYHIYFIQHIAIAVVYDYVIKGVVIMGGGSW